MELSLIIAVITAFVLLIKHSKAKGREERPYPWRYRSDGRPFP